MDIALQELWLAAPGISPIVDRSEDWVRYMYFITAMLHAFETLLQVSGKDELWKTALKTHLHYHRRYFITPRFAPTLATYDPRLQGLIREVMEEANRE